MLSVTDANGASASASGTVTIVAGPTASFTSSGPDTLGQTTSFTATASGSGPLSYAWDFGDGSSGSGANPTHIYTDIGSYSVTLTVTDANGAAVTSSAAVLIEAAVTQRTIFLPLVGR